MAVTRSRLNTLHAFAFKKHGLAYGYGGQFSRTDPRASTDCSGVTGAAGAYIASGNDADLYRRHGSTESWRTAPGGRYLGMVKVARASDIPRDAVLRAGFQHGGGGPYSHTACTIEHANWESRGTPGVLYGSAARAWNDALFDEYWYVPGPVVNDLSDSQFPLPEGFVYGPYSGPENSISGRAGEPADWVNGLKRWQHAAGIPATGIYDDATASTARAVQRAAGFSLVDGLIGAKTWPLVVKESPMPAAPRDPLAAMSREDRIFHELTYPFASRVENSGYTDTLAGYVLNIDKATYSNRLDLEAIRPEVARQGRALDAIVAHLGLSVVK